MRILTLALLTWVLLISTSCRTGNNRPPPYNGPTESMETVIQAINANNASIPTIWTDHTFTATIHDDKGKEHDVDGDGVLLFRKPGELLLQGTSIMGKLFEIGCTVGPEAQYWVAVVPEIRTEWWGYYKNLGAPCAAATKIPIRPDLVVEVLGVSDIDENFLRPPLPTMRFNNDENAYMLTWAVPLADRWVVQKEVWYDRVTKLPKAVLLFDENGRILLRAYLSKHEAVDGADGKKIATKYEMYFPESRDRLVFNLKSPKLSKRGVPRAGTIQRRPIGDDVREIQIDRDCP